MSQNRTWCLIRGPILKYSWCRTKWWSIKNHLRKHCTPPLVTSYRWWKWMSHMMTKYGGFSWTWHWCWKTMQKLSKLASSESFKTRLVMEINPNETLQIFSQVARNLLIKMKKERYLKINTIMDNNPHWGFIHMVVMLIVGSPSHQQNLNSQCAHTISSPMINIEMSTHLMLILKTIKIIRTIGIPNIS